MGKNHIIFLSPEANGEFWTAMQTVHGSAIDRKLDDAFKNSERDVTVYVEIKLYHGPDKPRTDRELAFVTSRNDFFTDLFDAMRDDFTEMRDEFEGPDGYPGYQITGIVASYA
jgi:hypothetical protein